jgi:hypothetical protein
MVSGVYVWNFTALAPAFAACSIIARALSIEPLWFPDISAITNGFSDFHNILFTSHSLSPNSPYIAKL